MSEAQNKWDKQNTKKYAFKLNIRTDAELIRKMESVSNKQGYIKELIRKDLEKEKSE